jgi:hypothetical protein
MSQDSLDNQIVELHKASRGFGLDYELLVLDTIRTAMQMKQVKKKLDSGFYKSDTDPTIEDLYKLHYMSLELSARNNMAKMIELLLIDDSVP